MVAILLVVALAGCTGSNGPTPDASTDPSEVDPPGAKKPSGNGSGSGTDRHRHDLWRDRDRLTLMQDPVLAYLAHNHLFDEPPREQHTHNCERDLAAPNQGGTVFFSFPPGHVVPPGTKAVDFSFSWDSPTITGVRFGYIAPPTPELTMVGAVDNGDTLRVEVNASMADPGHATKSRWLLYLCAGGDRPADLARGYVDVKAVAHKAQTIPEEPPHPDRWDGREAIPVAQGQYHGRSAGVLNQGDGVWTRLQSLPGGVVPPDAGEVLVRAMMHTSGQSPVPPSELTLYINHPGMSPYNWTQVEATRHNTSSHTWTFRVPVTVDTSDGMYANETFWRFSLRASSETQETLYGRWSAPFADPSIRIEGRAYAIKVPGSTPPAALSASPCRARLC